MTTCALCPTTEGLIACGVNGCTVLFCRTCWDKWPNHNERRHADIEAAHEADLEEQAAGR